jgi:DNA (cytosine-5)-methyltransferase 1
MEIFTSVELCAGGGGQSLGLEQAGFQPLALVENDYYACQTLQFNRPNWPVYEVDLHQFCGLKYQNIDLLAAGIPCPPFSKAGLQLGDQDERNLFPATLRIVKESIPKMILIENVRGLLESRFEWYRSQLERDLKKLGYRVDWKLVNAVDFGVPQVRLRSILIGIRQDLQGVFNWPAPQISAPTVGETLYDLMASNGWEGAQAWRYRACKVAPTLVGGSKKHGGPDLGPSRAKKDWELLWVNAHKIANEPPPKNFLGDRVGFEEKPCLTVRMAARLQGFPDSWHFCGKKTASYRQVGNAFPPPVARAIGIEINRFLCQSKSDLSLQKEACTIY